MTVFVGVSLNFMGTETGASLQRCTLSAACDEPHRTYTDRSRVGEMILGWGRRNHSRSIHVRKRDRLARRYDDYSVASNFKEKNN
jgi:hypothetical protein